MDGLAHYFRTILGANRPSGEATVEILEGLAGLLGAGAEVHRRVRGHGRCRRDDGGNGCLGSAGYLCQSGGWVGSVSTGFLLCRHRHDRNCADVRIMPMLIVLCLVERLVGVDDVGMIRGG